MKTWWRSVSVSRGLWLGLIVGVAVVAALVLSSQVLAVPVQQAPAGTVNGVYLPIVFKAEDNVGGIGTPTPSPTPMYIGAVNVGPDPYDSASDEVDEVFVANYSAGTLSVLQGSTETAVISGFTKPYGVAFNPVNNRIYVTDEATGELAVVDPATHTIVKKLGGLDRPRGIGIDRNTGTAFVASPGWSGSGAVRVYTLSDVTNSSQGTLINSVGVGPSWVAVDPVTHKAFVTLQGEADYGLAVIDGAQPGYPVTHVGLNTPGAFGIAYNPNNQRLYVASGTGSILSVVDVNKVGSAENPVIAAHKTTPEYNLDTLDVNPNTGHVFVAGRRELTGKVWIFDGGANAWLDTPFGIGPCAENSFFRGVTFDPVRAWFYVSSDHLDQVFIFSDEGEPAPTTTPSVSPSVTVSTTPTATPSAPCYPAAVGTPVAVGAAPYGSASDETDEVFVANHSAGTVSVLRGNIVVATISGFSQPFGVAYNPVNDRIYVTDENTGELVLLNPDTYAIEKRLGGLARPRGLGIDRVTGAAFVTSPGTGAVGDMRVYTFADVSNPFPTEGTLVNGIGPYPSYVVVDSETHRVYVTLNGDTRLAVIEPHFDGSLLTYPFTTVNLNVSNPMGVAYNENTKRLYVASGASVLSVVDVTKVGSGENPVIAALKTTPEYNLDTVAVNSLRRRVLVTGRMGTDSKMWVLDADTNIWNTSYNIGSNPTGLLWYGTTYDPVHRWVYVSNQSENRVYVFDDSWGPACPHGGPWTPSPTPAPCYPRAMGAPVNVGLQPYGSAAVDGTAKVFVANHGKDGMDGSVSVLEGTTVIASIATGGSPYGVAYNPLNQRIYVTDEALGQLLIIDPTTYVVEKRLGGLANPRGVAIDRITGDAYVASPGTEGQGVIKKYTLNDVANNTQGQPAINVGNWPSWIAVDSMGRVYVTTENELVRLEGTNSLKWGLPGAFGIAYNSSNQRLYTASSATLTVWDVAGTGNPVIVTSLKTEPEYLLDVVAVNPTSGRVFVTGRKDFTSKLWVLDGNTNHWLNTNFTVGSYELVGGRMRGVSYNPHNGYVTVSNELFNKVYIFADNGSPACP